MDIRRGCALATVLSLAACHSPQAALPHVAVAPLAPIAFGNDDVFEMRVYGEQELSGTYRIGADGTVSLPLCGSVAVAGLTPNEASDRIAERLALYLQAPHVSLFVKEYNSKKVYVFGEVRNPGTFAFAPGMNIVQAITLAGGFDKLADKAGAFVNRVVDGEEARLKVSVKGIGEGKVGNFALQPGDIIYIPETFF